MSIEEQVRKFIFENFLFGDERNELNADDSFLEKGIVDSTGILELVSFIEENFNLQVEDEELVPDNLDSLNKVAAYVRRKTEG